MRNTKNAFTLAEVFTPHFAGNRKDAFTLAEVLITLGIIGVVAAMTMPTLINQTNGAQYKAAYKKALSAISQAVTLNVALDDWSFADLKTDATDATKSNTIEKMLTERMNVLPDVSVNATNYTSDIGIDSNNTTLFFNDGIMFTFNDTASQECTKPSDQSVEAFVKTNKAAHKCVGFIDVNGLKGPNKEVKCDDQTNSAENCVVTHASDIYPVAFFDQSILPATNAARAVLYGK